MKYIVILGDGMAGLPLPELGNRTTLEAARTPVMDGLAGKGEMGLVQNVPAGLAPGSDVANLSVLGYDPKIRYTGRAPLEALGMGISLKPGEIALRCNLVTLSEEEEYPQKRLLDFVPGSFSPEEAELLWQAAETAFDRKKFRFYPGTGSHRICICSRDALPELARPHDHLNELIGPLLPADPELRAGMEAASRILRDHPLNRQAAEKGQAPSNGIWFWGAGTAPELPPFSRETGMAGAMITAVDLMRGIAAAAGLTVLEVPGADGTLDTDYRAKARAAERALLEEGFDFVYLHVEAPDACGHRGRARDKIRAIEQIDSQVIAPLLQALEASGEPFRMLVLPDHPTPVALRTHTADPVPYLLYDSRRQARKLARFSEREAEFTELFVPEGKDLLAELLSREE